MLRQRMSFNPDCRRVVAQSESIILNDFKCLDDPHGMCRMGSGRGIRLVHSKFNMNKYIEKIGY